MPELRQSTATTIVIGPFVDASDGSTPETGLTISQGDVRLSKNGAAFAQKSDASSATHMENGQYACALNTTDTNTAGRLRVTVYESGALIWWAEYDIVTTQWWDSKYSTDNLQTHAVEMSSGLITSSTIAANALNANALASDAVTEIQSGLATASALSTLSSYVDTEVASILTAVDTEVAAILAKVNYLPNATAGQAGGLFIAGSNAATTVNFTGNLSGSVGSVTGNVGGNVNGSVGSLGAQAKTDVNAQVSDVLATDARPEPTSVPAANAATAAKIDWLFMLARNKRLTTATADKVRNDADSADVGTAALSDDGTTFTRGEYA